MPKARTVKVACEGSTYYDISVLKPFQQGIKSLDDDDAKQLRDSIEINGFSFPFFVWVRSNHFYLLDGHQRLKVLTGMREEGWIVPELPAVDIHARTKAEAKRKLLAASSQYGQFEVGNLEGFLDGLSLEDLDFVKLPGLELESILPGGYEIEVGAGEIEIDEVETQHECPKCGFRW